LLEREGLVFAGFLLCQCAVYLLRASTKVLVEVFKILDFQLEPLHAALKGFFILLEIPDFLALLVLFPRVLVLIPLYLVELLLELDDLVPVFGPALVNLCLLLLPLHHELLALLPLLSQQPLQLLDLSVHLADAGLDRLLHILLRLRVLENLVFDELYALENTVLGSMDLLADLVYANVLVMQPLPLI